MRERKKLMRRKVIKLGDDTLVVSLPSAWARQHKIRKGDELEAEEQGARLIIYPLAARKDGKVSVDVSGARPMVKRILGALYKVGYDEFEVRFESPEELSAIKEVMSEFVGFEIVEEGKSQVTVRNVSHIIPDEFDSMFRKMIFVIGNMAQEGLACAKSKDWKRLQMVASSDADVNRYADFCRRVLNTLGHKVVKRAAPSYFLVEQLEKIGDGFRDICLFCSANKIQLSEQAAIAYSNTADFFRQFMALHAKFSIAALTEFARRHYELKVELEKLLQSSDRKELPVVALLKSVESDIFDLNGALMAEKL